MEQLERLSRPAQMWAILYCRGRTTVTRHSMPWGREKHSVHSGVVCAAGRTDIDAIGFLRALSLCFRKRKGLESAHLRQAKSSCVHPRRQA